MNGYFKYRFTEKIDFNVNEGEFITIVGNNNDLFINTLVFGHPKCNVFVGDKELNKKKPKVRSKEVSGAHGEHRDAKQIISVLKKMKKDNVGKAC